MKKILLYVILVVCAIGANAQEVTPEEAAKLKKDVNEIKRSGDFIYAEGLAEYLSDDGDKAITQAQKQSMDKLHTQVVMVFAQNLHMTPEDVEEIWDVIEDKCQNVEITVGDVTRSFRYVAKEVFSEKVANLFPEKKKKKEAKADAELAQVPDAEKTVAPAPQPIATEPVKQAEEPVVAQVVEEEKTESEVETEPVTVAVEEKKNDAPPQLAVEESKEETVIAQPTEEPKKETVVAQPVEEPKKETVTAPAEPVVETPKEEAPKKEETPVAPAKEEPVVAPAPVVKVEVPALCQTMLAKKDYVTLYHYLNEERAAGNLIFGSANKMARVAECYIVIINKATKNIVTVLDKGVNDRLNFVTGKMDDFVNYQLEGGYSAIYVQKL